MRFPLDLCLIRMGFLAAGMDGNSLQTAAHHHQEHPA
jgi:hypothetical protein